METKTLAFEARGLSRRSSVGEGWILFKVTFSLSAGDRLALVGPSGAGKTLLLRAMACLDPLDEGEIRWNGRTVGGDLNPRFRRHVMYLHQHPALQDATVEAILREPFRLKVYRRREFDRQHTVELIEACGRDASFLSKQRTDLSGGEAQIVALIRAVQLEPEILLLDEPTASLDAATTQHVEGIIDRWASEQPDGRALVWVCHDQAQAERISNRMLRIRDGRIEERN